MARQGVKYGFPPFTNEHTRRLLPTAIVQASAEDTEMELVLILLYTSICIVIFKIFRIPVNQWSLSTAVLGGIVGIALLLIGMAYNHPFSANACIYFSVTPVYAGVRGRVIDVPVKANVPLKAGDVLFQIDPRPYQLIRIGALVEMRGGTGYPPYWSRPPSVRAPVANAAPVEAPKKGPGAA